VRTWLRVMRGSFEVVPLATVCGLLWNIIDGVFPAFTALMLTRLFDIASGIVGSDGGDLTQLLTVGAVYLGVYLLRELLNLCFGYIIEFGRERQQVSFRYEICRAMAWQPLIAFEDAHIKDKQRRAEEGLYNGQINRIRPYTLSLFKGAIGLVSVSAVLARYSLWFLPLCALSVLPYLAARLVSGRAFYRIRHTQAKRQRKLAYLWGLFTDRRSNKELRVSGADDYVYDTWTNVRDVVQEEQWRLRRKYALSFVFCDVFRIVGYAACVALTLSMTLSATVSVGVFGACIAAFVSLQSAMQSVLELGGDLPQALSYASDYFEFVNLPPEVNGSVSPRGLTMDIELRDVSFKYPNSDSYAVRNLSLSLREGEKLAVIGENGSGKTTLTKLLLGMLPLNSGVVRFGGKDVATLDRTKLYERVSAVAQNFTRYKLTLRENIAMSDISRLLCDRELEAALRDVGLSDLSKAVGLSGEMDNAFGGSDISGGQWQKLAIARGLFCDSDLIILDEPTSALDPLVETEILTKFIELAAGRTAVIISHRVGLCRLVDRIAVMRDGELAELGTHDELMALGGHYREMFTAQAHWYND
jgi:ATP-binding cassette subfamily B protein